MPNDADERFEQRTQVQVRTFGIRILVLKIAIENCVFQIFSAIILRRSSKIALVVCANLKSVVHIRGGIYEEPVSPVLGDQIMSICSTSPDIPTFAFHLKP